MGSKSFLKQFVSLGMGSIIYLLVGFIGTPIITRLVDPASYGDFSVFSVYSSLGFSICILGLDQAYIRFFYSNESVAFRRRLLYKCMVPGLVCALLTGIAASLIFVQHARMEALLVTVNIVLLIVSRYSILNARLTNQTNLYSTINIVQKSVYLMLAIILVSSLHANFYQILVFATMFGTSVSSTIGIVRTKSLWLRIECDAASGNIQYSELFNYGLPLTFSLGITSLMNALDKLALDRFCTRSDVGIYTSAMNLLAVFSVIRTSFNALWMPSAVEAYEKDENHKEYFQKGNAFITILMLLFGAGMIMCKDLFVILLGEEYRSAALIFPFLMFEPIMYTISETTVTGLVVSKKSGYQIIAAITACVTNFIGNWVLTPRMGPQGAAISTGFSYIVFFAMRTLLANRVCYINYSLPKLSFMTALLAVYAVYGSFTGFTVYQVMIFVLYSVILLLVYRKESAFAFQYVRTLVSKYRR